MNRDGLGVTGMAMYFPDSEGPMEGGSMKEILKKAALLITTLAICLSIGTTAFARYSGGPKNPGPPPGPGPSRPYGPGSGG